jgi:hypothetical protein
MVVVMVVVVVVVVAVNGLCVFSTCVRLDNWL